ncbi:MAG: hypothetical protein GF347_05525 [Candidatus Moranbacteria bacterium]|nr:hypothetical protein [Candidatus Moranbacteria bacterium]
MGNGSYEAAQYLNSLQNAAKITVWTDKRGVCQFFKGICLSGDSLKKQKDQIQYLVLSAGTQNRTGNVFDLANMENIYNHPNPDFHLKIGNRENDYVKVINLQKVKLY